MSTEDKSIGSSEVMPVFESEQVITEQDELLEKNNNSTKEQNVDLTVDYAILTEQNEHTGAVLASQNDEQLENPTKLISELDEAHGEHTADILVEKNQPPLDQAVDDFAEKDEFLAGKSSNNEPQTEEFDFLTEAKQNKPQATQRFDILPREDELLAEQNEVSADQIESQTQQKTLFVEQPENSVAVEDQENVQEPSTSVNLSQSTADEVFAFGAESEKPITHSASSNVDETQQQQNEEEEEDKKSEVGELIADIFGESDDEEAEELANEETVEDAENTAVDEDDEENQLIAEEYLRNELGDEEEDHEEIVQHVEEEKEIVSDFDLIMQKRKEENQRRRRRKRDYDFINNNDDLISDLLKQMEHAAKEDAELNSMKLPATRKRSLLKTIVTELKKADLVSAFIECGVISHMAEWLSLLPDKSLPSLEIRTEFLKLLQTFPTLDHQILRSSNIGKAVMLLLKHPKETKENKECARKLINEWARPIFNLQTDYRSVTKDERMKRDFDHMPSAKKRRLSMESEKQSGQTKLDEKVLGPGDKGFIGRARVPRPSTRDYVVRPKWNVETEFRRNSSKKQTSSEMDKKIREIKMRTAANKATHAVNVSIGGRKM